MYIINVAVETFNKRLFISVAAVATSIIVITHILNLAFGW